jgi:glycosyltransferase involved in cell wall biosynthesis
VAVAVQRYGADINGGAELHARYIAERLARHSDVEVVTTCARDYVTWRNELPQGTETINGVAVRRFRVERERDPHDFGRRSHRVFDHRHSMADELAWLESEGPTSRSLVNHLVRGAFDFVILFSYRYYHAYHAARTIATTGETGAAEKAVATGETQKKHRQKHRKKVLLVPTAERDPAIGLRIFAPVFRAVDAIMYNSFEERAMIETVSQNGGVPGVVVGVGSEIPERTDAQRFRKKFGVTRPFAIYIGRIDENKGCKELFDFYRRYAATFPRGLDLVLAGSAIMPVPDHPRIHHLGFVSDEDKFDALAASDLLIMPSFFESLSMVALEAWAIGKPVLANGRCDVLKGQCIRSGAGLYYENYAEFAEALYALESNGPLHARLGGNGREYFRAHYTWPVIERKYLEMFDRLKRTGSSKPIDPLPNWFERRKKEIPPASEILDALPSGAVVPQRV